MRRQNSSLADEADPARLFGIELRRAAQLQAMRSRLAGQLREIGHAVGIGQAADDDRATCGASPLPRPCHPGARRCCAASFRPSDHNLPVKTTISPLSTDSTAAGRARVRAEDRPAIRRGARTSGRCSRWSRKAPMSIYNQRTMILAGDVGGTKTLIGLFQFDAERPVRVDVRSFRPPTSPDSLPSSTRSTRRSRRGRR